MLNPITMSKSYTNFTESMFKLKNQKDIFIESINLERAKILLNLDDDKFKSLIWIDDNNNENGQLWSTDDYIKSVKKFLLRVINQNGQQENTYKYSVKMLDCGRMYVNKFGIQSLQKQLRGYLTGDRLIDFDMCSAHPTILYYICTRWYRDYEWTELKKYVGDRDSYLKQHKLTKIDVLKMMNSCRLSTKLKLDQEFKLIQELLYTKTAGQLSFFNNLKTEKQNVKGKFLNKILCIFENMILHTALSTLPSEKIKVKMFDGFMTDNNININDTINTLNNSTSEYGIKWSVKEPDLSIEDKLKDVDTSKKDVLNYEAVKLKFEKKHFMIENPLLFGREYEKDGLSNYSFYNSNDFQIITKPYVYEDLENGKLVKKSIYSRWIADKTRRSYKSLDFIPNNNYVSTADYNTFTGFECDTRDKQYVENETVVKDFINHIGLLTDFDKPSVDYINKYIAHIIQYAHINPESCLLFKSNQGFGKDLLINYIEKMIGVKYVCRTEDVDDIFGKFNSVIKDKILLQFNELEGKDGILIKEKIKGLIDQKKTQIREKHVKGYTQTNYLRIIICSNNLTPIAIDYDDRRFCVFQCTQCKPSYQYFEKLWGYLKDDYAMYTLYDYYNNLDIKDFVPRQERPKTKAYEAMKQANMNPFFKYINQMFRGDEYKFNFQDNYKVHKRTKNVIIQPSKIYNDFKSWCNIFDERQKIDFKVMKALLEKLGIYSKQLNVNNNRTDFYLFDLEPLRAKLKDIGFVEEEDSDDENWE